MNYTQYGYRLKYLSNHAGYSWLFLPGGPGLGSEYLHSLCHQLHLPGSITLIDFPKDGTNTQGVLNIKYWQEGLIDLLQNFSKPILVTHSFAGMFALNLPELKNHLTGLVLMNTTTKNSFFEHVSAMQLQHHLPDLIPAASQYHLSPSNETYKEFWKTYKYYCFTAEEMQDGEKMIPLFAFNNAAYHMAIEHFYPDYSCKWLPAFPTLTIASENDYICPPKIFIENEGFQSQNIINKIIAKAGHVPWINTLNQVQLCFDVYIKKLNETTSP